MNISEGHYDVTSHNHDVTSYNHDVITTEYDVATNDYDVTTNNYDVTMYEHVTAMIVHVQFAHALENMTISGTRALLGNGGADGFHDDRFVVVFLINHEENYGFYDDRYTHVYSFSLFYLRSIFEIY